MLNSAKKGTPRNNALMRVDSVIQIVQLVISGFQPLPQLMSGSGMADCTRYAHARKVSFF